MKKAMLLIGLLFIMPNISSAAGQNLDRKQVYELQVQCGKQAEEVFKQWYPSSPWQDKDGSQNMVNFNNHYNKKLNKCFILTGHTSLGKKDGKFSKFDRKELSEIIEHKDFGAYSQLDDALVECNVLNKTCKSESQWDLLVKPYMEE